MKHETLKEAENMIRKAYFLTILLCAVALVSSAQEQQKEEYISTAEQDMVVHDELIALPGKEARVIRVGFPAGWIGERHYHTGDVFVYVLEGEFVVDVDGEGRKRFRPGEVYHEAVNTVMQASNPSTDVATKAIVFQVGDKGEPMMILADDSKDDG